VPFKHRQRKVEKVKDMKKEKNYQEEYVMLSGIRHYLLHYRAKPEAPVFLFIHGGPGQSEAFLAYIVEEYAGRNYNIVYYDQRGSGKTYLKNKKERPNTEILKQDLLEIVQYLKKVYKKEKIGILGHSWGSVLGSMFALEHPEHTLMYIGCGQVVNIMENERVGFSKLKAAVTKSGNQKDRKKLARIGKYPVNHFDRKVYRKMGMVRSLQAKYKLAAAFDKKMFKIIFRSPIMGMRDLLPFMTGMVVNMQVMKELMAFDLKAWGVSYQVPVYYVLGEKDQQTPVEIGTAYFREIEAPDKKLYTIRNAGHLAMLDNVTDYRNAVCNIAARFADT